MSVSAEVEAHIKETGQGAKSHLTKCTEEGMFHPGESLDPAVAFFFLV